MFRICTSKDMHRASRHIILIRRRRKIPFSSAGRNEPPPLPFRIENSKLINFVSRCTKHPQLPANFSPCFSTIQNSKTGGNNSVHIIFLRVAHKTKICTDCHRVISFSATIVSNFDELDFQSPARGRYMYYKHFSPAKPF